MAKGKKTGGRKKGTPNKKTLNASIIAEEIGVDPFQVLMHFVVGDYESLGIPELSSVLTKEGVVEKLSITPEMRLSAAKEACQYIYPKRKAIEQVSEINQKTYVLAYNNDEIDVEEIE
jgi:hypothetical protein